MSSTLVIYMDVCIYVAKIITIVRGGFLCNYAQLVLLPTNVSMCRHELVAFTVVQGEMCPT